MADYYDKQEQRMGISAYASPESQGFAAVLKARYSDFVVHEVDVQGNMARLDSLENNLKEKVKTAHTCGEVENEKQQVTDNKRSSDTLEASEKIEPIVKKSRIENKEDGVQSDNPKFDEEKQGLAKEKLSVLIGEESAKKAIEMLAFWENSSERDENYPKNVMFPLIEDKDKRKAIHMLIRSDLLSCCSLADTVDKKVRIWHRMFEREMPNFGNFSRDKGKQNRSKNRKKVDWPKNRPNFLKFVLYKENIDTGTAARDISYAARLPPKGKGGGGVGYAGMKDKRGITSQYCTIYRKTPDVILSLNNNKREHKGNNFGGGNTKFGGSSVIKVGNFSFVDREVRLGELSGNRFDIALRNVCVANSYDLATDDEKRLKITRDHVIANCNAMKENGFINYFGMQRFGKFYDTHEVGIAILKGDYERACEIILRVKETEGERQTTLRKRWESRFNGVEMTDENAVREAEAKCARSVLKNLGRFMTCETSILNGLSRRPRDYKNAFQNIAKNLRSMFLHAYQSFLWNKAVSYRIKTWGSKSVIVGDLVLVEDKAESEGGGGTSGLKGKSVKILNEEDVKSNNYTINDVVLSLVGTKVEYPNNSTGEFYDSLLAEDGLTKSDFKKINDRELSLCGDYRKIICKPTDIEFEIKAYSDPLQPLIRSDLMKVRNVELDCIDLTDEYKITTDENEQSRKNLIGMIIGFTLPASTYATVALRELMRRPTSSEYQSSLKLEGDCEAALLEMSNRTIVPKEPE